MCGSTSIDTRNATLASLERQTLRLDDVKDWSNARNLPVKPDDLIFFVAAGVCLERTAFELLAAAFLSVQTAKFAAAPMATSFDEHADKAVGLFLIRGDTWRASVQPSLSIASGVDELVSVLCSTLKKMVGEGLLLPFPLGTSAYPIVSFDECAWPLLLAPRQLAALALAPPGRSLPRPTVCCRSREARKVRIAATPAADCTLASTWRVGNSSFGCARAPLKQLAHNVITTLAGDHGLSAEFGRFADTIYHVGDIFDWMRVDGFISGWITANNPDCVLSSNAGALHRALPLLKMAHPTVEFVDLLHNDMANGLFGSAVAVSASLYRHIAVSRRVGEALVSRGIPRDRIVVVPNGIDTALFNPQRIERSAARDRSECRHDVLLLVFIGRFSKEKRVGAFADIVGRVRQEMPVQAVAVGEGEQEFGAAQRIAGEDLPIRIFPQCLAPSSYGCTRLPTCLY